MEGFKHTTVLLDEAVQGLNIKADGVYVDATLGGGGHSKKIAQQLDHGGILFAFDQDEQAIQHADQVLKKELDQGRVTLVQDNFRNLKDTLNYFGVEHIDGIIYDLGVSSPQLDEAERGFSYQQDAPLDMRMDRKQALTAEDIVNQWSVEDLSLIFKRYGEEKYAKRIASIIGQRRDHQSIQTTHDLVDCIKAGIPAASRRTGGHPAKRVFQALRIAVNDELAALESSLIQALELLAVGGRISAISFHSLEDRIIKTIFKEYTQAPQLPSDLPLRADQLPQADYKLVNRKVIQPSKEERMANNRSRSAKLRIIERIKA